MSANTTVGTGELGLSLKGLAAYFLGVILIGVRIFSSSLFLVAVLDGILLIYLCAAVWVLSDLAGQLRALKLLSLFNAIYYGIVGLMLLAMEAYPGVFHIEALGLLYRRVGGDPIANLDRGFLLALTAQVALTAAFLFPLARRRPRSMCPSQLVKVMPRLERRVVLASVTLAYIVSRVWPDHLPLAAAHVVTAWGTLFEAMLAMRLVRWLRKKPGRVREACSWAWIATVIVAVALYTGWRGRVIELATLMVIAAVADRGKVPLRWVAVGALAFGLFIIPWSIMYRPILWGGPDEGLAARSRAAQIAAQQIAGMSLQDRASLSFSFVAVRVGGQRIDELSGMAAQPTRLHGESIWPFVLAPVPRALWPSKPQISPELNVIAHTLGKGEPTDFQTSTVWTQYTDLVLNFDVVGLLVGSLILGFLARWLNSVFLVVGRRTPEAVGLFTLFFGPLWREYPVGFVYQLEVQFLLMLAAIWLISRSVRARSRVRA